jgi:NADPH2:quinone reductase
MSKAIRIHQTGGPEVLRWEDVEVGAPGDGEILLRQTAVGLNYIDTYHRSGLYPLELPAILGREAAGVVEATGPGVEGLTAGDRVAYALEPGAYCESRVIAAARVVRLPETVDDRAAASMMLKGLTARYLLRGSYRVRPGDTILIHAAAGGVGLIACQWAKAIGATVLGTVGSEEKAALAADHGCDHTILYKQENFVERVRELTAGTGVAAVYDSVGRDTFDGSLECLATHGTLVSFGQSSGPVAPFNIGVLAAKGSLHLTRPTLAHFIATPAQLGEAAAELFALHASGGLRIETGRSYPLNAAAQAHRDLEARKTYGSTLLLP